MMINYFTTLMPVCQLMQTFDQTQLQKSSTFISSTLFLQVFGEEELFGEGGPEAV